MCNGPTRHIEPCEGQDRPIDEGAGPISVIGPGVQSAGRAIAGNGLAPTLR
jgi:hypothetical protein